MTFRQFGCLAPALLLSLAMAAASIDSARAQALPNEAALTAQGGKRLTGADFEKLYVGNTLSGQTSDGDAFHVFVESKTAYRMEFQGKRTASSWNVGKDGEFCTLADGETTCTREYEKDKVIYSFNADGSPAGSATLRPGNPEKL